MTVSAPVWQIDFASCRPFLLSVVVPVYNEIEVLPLFMERLLVVLESVRQPCEVVLVDDGSTDGSAELLQRMAVKHKFVRVIWLSRNFGKEAAVTAGLESAKGDATILIDADLQDPPELIPEMIEHWRDGADMVCMRRRSRAGESWFKRTSAALFYRLLNRISRFDIPPDTGDFRLISRRALNSLNRLPERNRYMKGLFAWVGMPTRVVMYDREPRAAGDSKWKTFSLLALAFEGITSFSVAPLRWVTGTGIAAAMWGALFGFWIVFKAMFFGDPVAGYPSLMSVLTFLGGVQLLTVGLVGEYVGKIYTEVKQRPIYQIRETSEDVPSSRVMDLEQRFESL